MSDQEGRQGHQAGQGGKPQGTGTATRRDPWSWGDPSPYRCPRCGAITLTRDAGVRCPGCGFMGGPS